MACASHIGNLDSRYIILLLLCLLLLVGPHIDWKTQGLFRTRNVVSVFLKKTIQVAKDWELLNLTQSGTYGYNDMYTCVDTCCAGKNWKLVSLPNEVCEVSSFMGSY